MKIDFLKNFAKFSEKHLCRSVSFNQLYLKRDSGIVVSCEFCEIFKNIIFREHLRTTASYDSNDKDVTSDVDLRLKKKYIEIILHH